MSIPGRLLSQPASVTMPSNRSPCIMHSTESAMISREESEARMPSVPIEMPSDTAMVVNSSGKPPATRTPSLAALARRDNGRLQGVTSFQEEAMPTWERPQSPSPIPTARSIARAGARSIPSVTSLLRGLCWSFAMALERRAPAPTRAPRGAYDAARHTGEGSPMRVLRGLVVVSMVVLLVGACSNDKSDKADKAAATTTSTAAGVTGPQQYSVVVDGPSTLG